jgi:beta-lactamase class A
MSLSVSERDGVYHATVGLGTMRRLTRMGGLSMIHHKSFVIRCIACGLGWVGLLSALGAAAARTEAQSLPSEDLEERIRARLSTLEARASVYAQHVPTGREIAINADEAMNTASVIKIPIMVLAYRDAEAGRLDLDERREVTPDDYRLGSGLIQTFTPGLQPTLRDLVRQMIVTSDNIGTDIALGRVGLARVNGLLAQLGYQQTRLNMTTADLFRRLFVLADPKYSTLTDRELYELGVPPVPPDELPRLLEQLARDPADWLGQSTAREISRLLLQLLGGELASAAATEEMLDVLRGQFYDSRLPRFIKEQATVAHKTGEIPPYVLNDVGIIFHEGGPTVVSVFVNENQGTVLQVEETIGRIAEDLLRAWGP